MAQIFPVSARLDGLLTVQLQPLPNSCREIARSGALPEARCLEASAQPIGLPNNCVSIARSVDGKGPQVGTNAGMSPFPIRLE
jgi:hypothetical protein